MIDINKKYRTRACAEVRIYAVDVDGAGPVHGAFKSPAGWVVSCWRQDGTQLDLGGHYDLIELKPRIKRTLWVNIYPDGERKSTAHSKKEKADRYAIGTRLACVKVEIDCEEGEGL
jgi:hypothetical protein